LFDEPLLHPFVLFGQLLELRPEARQFIGGEAGLLGFELGHAITESLVFAKELLRELFAFIEYL
jgi:hypothetical protein